MVFSTHLEFILTGRERKQAATWGNIAEPAVSHSWNRQIEFSMNTTGRRAGGQHASRAYHRFLAAAAGYARLTQNKLSLTAVAHDLVEVVAAHSYPDPFLVGGTAGFQMVGSTLKFPEPLNN